MVCLATWSPIAVSKADSDSGALVVVYSNATSEAVLSSLGSKIAGAVVTFSPFVSPLVFKDRRVGVAGGSVL